MTESINQAPGTKAAYDPTGSTQAPGSTVAPSGYPDNPAPFPAVNDAVAAGKPQKASTFSQGISILSPCPTCAVAYQPDQLGAHAQTHGQNFYTEGSDFGQRTAQLDDSGRYTLKS